MKQQTLMTDITDETKWGWKNTETGTICQNVIQDSPKALWEYSGLEVPADPTAARNGFQPVPVRLVRIDKMEYVMPNKRKHKWDQMVIEEVK